MELTELVKELNEGNTWTIEVASEVSYQTITAKVKSAKIQMEDGKLCLIVKYGRTGKLVFRVDIEYAIAKIDYIYVINAPFTQITFTP